MRLGQRFAITAQGLREQAEQLGVLDTAEVIVLAPAAYAELAAVVWPNTALPLAGTRGIGAAPVRTEDHSWPRLAAGDWLGIGPNYTASAHTHSRAPKGRTCSPHTAPTGTKATRPDPVSATSSSGKATR